jgi:uncharacterized membrane protein
MGRISATCLAFAVLASQAAATAAVAQGPGRSTPPETASSASEWRDDFSGTGWGTATNADSSIEYDGEALRFVIPTTNYFTWSTPDAEIYENIRIELTVRNNGTHSTTAFGVMCNKDPASPDFYYLAMTPGGEYAIAKAVSGQSDLFLTNDDRWGTSEHIATNASFYRMSVECGAGDLRLFVDGDLIASVSDTSYSSGGVGLIVWSGQDADKTDVSFDDVVMTRLP